MYKLTCYCISTFFLMFSGCSLIHNLLPSDTVTFAWDATPGATFYRLYRSPSPDMTEPLEIVCETRKLRCKDRNVPSGLHYYGAKAYNGSEESDYSNIIKYERHRAKPHQPQS